MVSRVRCLGQDENKKTPDTECLVVAFGALFSTAKSILKMVAVSVSVVLKYYSFALSAAKVLLAQCSSVSLL